MAVITLKIVVGNLAKVMSVFDQVKVYRSTVGLDGPYVELTGPTTRIALVSSTMIYEYTDITGNSDYYYKTSYYNSTSGLESSKSDAQRGEGDPALDICSVEEVKINYLFGVDLTDDAGTPFPDSLYEWYIKSAVSWLEHKLDLPLRPKTIEQECHDYMWEDFSKFIYLHCKESPVLSVQEIRMVLPGETEGRVIEESWIHLRKDSGVIHLVPGSGNISTILLGGKGPWLSFLRAGARFVPDVFHINYTAGFEPGTVPAIIRDVVGKLAAFGPLNIAGDLIAGAGIASQSLSIDGLSQSISTTSSATNAGYGARLIQYKGEIKQVLPTIQRYYKGARLAVG
jgi:hypothetical protein